MREQFIIWRDERRKEASQVSFKTEPIENGLLIRNHVGNEDKYLWREDLFTSLAPFFSKEHLLFSYELHTHGRVHHYVEFSFEGYIIKFECLFHEGHFNKVTLFKRPGSPFYEHVRKSIFRDKALTFFYEVFQTFEKKIVSQKHVRLAGLFLNESNTMLSTLEKDLLLTR